MNKIVILVVIIVILGAVGGGVWFYLNKMQMPEPVDIVSPGANILKNEAVKKQIPEDSVSVMEKDLGEIETADLDKEFEDIDADLGSL